MATSGSCSSTFGTSNKYTLKVEWWRNSYDVANNKSNVTVTAYLISGGSSYNINSSVSKNGTLTINGTSYSVSFSCALSGNQTKQIASKTVDIYHNSDGTKSFSYGFSGNIGITFSSGYVGTISASGSGTLDTIPRTSSFTLSTTEATFGETWIGVSIHRASDAFTHRIYYKVGNIDWCATTNATTYHEIFPALVDCEQVPNSTVGIGSIQVDTYHGDTYIGSSSQTITLRVPDYVKPSFTSLGADVIASGADASYGFVQGKSKAQLSVWGATGTYGSWITNYHITDYNGSTWSQWQATSGTLWTTGNITFGAYVTDSRGRTSDVHQVTINVQPYSAPSISAFSAIRCNLDGTSNTSGTYAKASATYSYTSLGGRNTVSSKIEYMSSASSWIDSGSIDSGSSVVIGVGNLSVANSYQIRLTVSDNFTSTKRVVQINPEFVLLNFKQGGKGIGIGKYSVNDEMLEIGMTTDMHKDMNFVTPMSGINWKNDTDGAKIFFQNVGDDDTDSYLCIQTSDNGNEYILFNHNQWDTGIINLFSMHPEYGNITYKHFRPSTNGTHDCGTSNERWRTVFTINALNVASDRTLKENIKYLCEVPNAKASTSDELTINDMYDFVKDDLYLSSYNFISDETKDEKLGFIAQDIVDTKVGEKIIKHDFNTLGYDTGNFQAVISGALKVDILKTEAMQEEIDSLKEEIAQLKQIINELTNNK